jgi:hypothetical protein
MSHIACECEKCPEDTPPVQHITTAVDVEITRHRLKGLINRIKEGEADLPSEDAVYGDIDEFFDKDGEVKYFKKPVWTDEDLSEEFRIPIPDMKRFLRESYPDYCYEGRATNRIWKQTRVLSRIGHAYQAQKQQFAELKESYDALKGHCASYGEEDPKIGMLKAQIDLYKTHVNCLERDLSVEKGYRFEALKEANKNEELLQKEKKKFNIYFWVSLVIVVATHLIYLF